MTIFKNDNEAFQGLSDENRWIFNKLELSLKLGYKAGPSGVGVPEDGKYIIRPVYNLAGMSAWARVEQLKKEDTCTEPGFFWCEYIPGHTISVDYTFRKGQIYPVFAAQGFTNDHELYRYSKWVKLDPIPDFHLPPWIDNLNTCSHINIKFKGGNIVEIHGTHKNIFPKGAVEIYPVWEDTAQEQHYMLSDCGMTWKPNKDDAQGNIETARVGFYYK